MATPRRRTADGRYELLEPTGASPVGTTYSARHTLLASGAVVTLVATELADDPERRALLADSVRAAARLRHEHVAPAVDLATDGTALYVVEAPVEGVPLDVVLREAGPLAPADALPVARQVADALAHAHERGVMHGALAAGVVRLDRSSTPPRATVCGFALRAVESTGVMAPEAVRGEATDARTDVFALGLLLFELLEGKPFLPTAADEARALLLADGEPLLPRFSALVPAGVPALVARALRRAPDQRWQRMAEMRAAIDASLKRLGPASVATPRDTRPRRRVVMVVDDTANELPEAPAPTGARGSAVPRGVLLSSPRPRRSRRRGRAVSLVMAAAAALLLMALRLAPPGSAPAASTPVATVPPKPEPEVVEAAPVPASPDPGEPAGAARLARVVGEPQPAPEVASEPPTEDPPIVVPTDETEVETAVATPQTVKPFVYAVPSAPSASTPLAAPPAASRTVRHTPSTSRRKPREPRCATAPSGTASGRAHGPGALIPSL